MSGVKWVMLIVGIILIVIPEPATTIGGMILVLASFGVKGKQIT